MKSGDAARQSQGALKVIDVGAGPPRSRRRRRFGMPQVIRMGPPGNGGNLDAGGTQSCPQVVVLAAPAMKVLVIAVDSLVIGAGDAEVAAEQLGPLLIANQ